MRVVKNFGINIPASIETCKRTMLYAPSKRMDNFVKQAKKDFAEYGRVKR